MTPSQEAKHWRLWSAACRAQGWKSSDNASRYAQYALALGYGDPPSGGPSSVPSVKSVVKHISLKDLVKQSDIDKVFDHLTQLASHNTDLKAALRQANPEEGERKRLKYSIEHKADEAMWRHIASSRFGTEVLDDLSISQLTQLRNTLAARASSKKRRRLEPYDRTNRHALPAMAAAEETDPC